VLIDQGQQVVFRYRIEVTFQVRIDHENVTSLEFLLDDPKRIVGPSSMAKAGVSFMNLLVQYRFDYAARRPLDDSVTDRRNTQRSHLVPSSRFGNVNSKYRIGAIGLCFDFIGELACFHSQVFFEFLAALPVNSCRFLLPPCPRLPSP